VVDLNYNEKNQENPARSIYDFNYYEAIRSTRIDRVDCLNIWIWQRIGWLKLIVVILSAPILWVYCVLIFVFIPAIIFERVRQKMRERNHD
jgi:hypothetical protein